VTADLEAPAGRLAPAAWGATAPRWAVARVTARRAVRSGVVWGYVLGAVIASSALTYSKLYATAAERNRLAATYGPDRAVAALFGPARRLDTVAGFTAFKVSMTLTVLAAIWGLLTSTRLLRGEEEAGRWELLLAGRTTRSGAAAQAFAGLGGGAVALWAVTAALAVVAGRASSVRVTAPAALFLALAMVCPAVVFLALGMLTSQLAATRRQAAACAAIGLGASYGLRLVADAGIGLHGLVWLSPLGWIEELQPLTSPRPWPLLLIFGAAGALASLAVLLAGRRDLGSSALPDRARAKPRLALLANGLELTVRMLAQTAVGWITAVASTGLLLGMVAKSASGTISGSAAEVLARLGASGGGAKAFLGFSYLVVAVLLACAAAGQLAAARVEETSGRLDNLLVRPVSRTSWLAGRLATTLFLLVACGLLGGLCTWVGAVSQHSGIGLRALLEAGVNVVPPSLCVLGGGALAFGAWPSATSYLAHAIVGWSLLVEVIGGFGPTQRWLLDLSVFHQMAAVPAVTPNWTAAGVMVGIGVAGAAGGVLAFARRDLRGE